MRINHNIAALNTHRQLNSATTSQSKSMEKLASGLRINKAGDDAAGLAISEKMRGQIRGLDQASKNAQDGISMIQTAEGALSETHDILQRMRELAVQSANDTNTDSDRGEIQKEMNQLTTEINRIGNTTEFNRQNLLKGTNAEAVTTAADSTTVAAGETGIATGSLSDLATTAKSVVGKSSSAEMQGMTSKATGAVSTVTTDDVSAKGMKASVTVANGIKFEAATLGDDLNGTKISIQQGTATDSKVTYNATDGYTFTIGQNANGTSLASNRGELNNELTKALKELETNVGSSAADIAAATAISVAKPNNDTTSTPLSDITTSGAFASGVNEAPGAFSFDINTTFKEDGDTISIGGKTFTAKSSGADASKGEFNIGAQASTLIGGTSDSSAVLTGKTGSIEVTVGTDVYVIGNADLILFDGTKTESDLVNLFKNAADGLGKLSDVANVSIVDGKLNITATSSAVGATVSIEMVGADAADFEIMTGLSDGDTGTTAGAAGTTTSQADSLNMAINAVLGDHYTATNVAGEVTLTEKAGTATGVALANPTTAGSGTDNKLTITDTSGQNLKTLTIAQSPAVGGTYADGLTAVTDSDALFVSVDETTGNLTIELADTTASKNTADKIQAAIQALGTVNLTDGSGSKIDFSKYTVQSSGDWDTKETGSNINKATGTLVGGTAEVKGTYELEINNAFAEGDTVTIKGQTFTAVSGDADSTKGEFSIENGDKNSQAASLIDTMNLNPALSGSHTASATGNKITLTENKASGTDLKTTDAKVAATGVQGEYSIDAKELLTSGGSFSIDGEKITVSDKDTNVGYANGTAVKTTASLEDQTKAIADAINKNENLSGKYSASVSDSGQLVLNQKIGNTDAPIVETTTSTKGDFNASFQVGANSGQSMTIEVKDMRSEALGISGDGSASSVAAKDGKVASYVETANVSNGTSNTNSEFSLDISTHEKATSAISVLNDAVERVSAQRSQLGAFQNRLDHTINNLNTSSENLTAAESRIRDVDYAEAA